MKIAILGKTHSRKEAPFDDPSWTIWGVGMVHRDDTVPLYPKEDAPIGRWDAWFECHDMRDYHPGTENDDYLGHWEWMNRQTKPIYTLGTMDVPTAKVLPRDDLIWTYGAYFMRNTICWAMAYALHLGVDQIGLWGIEQASRKEYAREHHGVQHFIHLARALGVGVTMPDGCALRKSPKPYPDCFY